jgi:hypothetical protein
MPRPSVAPLQTLIGALVRNIDRSEQASSHLPETSAFLSYVKANLTWYSRLFHVAFYAKDSAIGTPLITDDVLTVAIADASAAVQQFTPLIKSLAEGTTDHMPYAIAGWLNREFERIRKQIPSCTSTGVSLCPVPDVNFFYQNLTNLSRAFENIRDTFNMTLAPIAAQGAPIPPTTPLTLPFYIGFQYALDEDVLFNAILFHELGHHVFREAGLQSSISAKLLPVVDTVLLAEAPEYKLLAADPSKDAERKQMQAGVTIIITQWLEELFCDAFATMIAGPQLAFAGRDLTGPARAPATFSESHPAMALRQTATWQLLESLGWTKSPSNASPFFNAAEEAFASLRPATALPTSWHWERAGVAAPLPIVAAVKVLQSKLSDIQSEAAKYVPDAAARAQTFWDQGDVVDLAFAAGVVPSTIRRSTSTGTVERIYPHPTTVINVARVIFETGCQELLKRWPGVNLKDPGYEHVRQIQGRLGAWTTKSIADWELIVLSGSSSGTSPP